MKTSPAVFASALFCALVFFATAVLGEDAVPAGFVKQELSETGGWVLQPAGWHFMQWDGSFHASNYNEWIISKDQALGPHYVVGMEVNICPDAPMESQQDLAQVAQAIVDEKRRDLNVKVISVGKPETRGLLKRMRLEMVDGEDHVVEWLYWGEDGLDVLAFVTMKAPVAEWAASAPLFEKMGDRISLFDPAVFGAGPVADLKPAQLAGRWHCDRGDFTVDYTFNKEGTYTSRTREKLGVGLDIRNEGKWSLPGNGVLKCRILKSTLGENAEDEDEISMVVGVAKDYFINDTGHGVREKFVRVTGKK